jgi:hypothetical protein
MEFSWMPENLIVGILREPLFRSRFDGETENEETPHMPICIRTPAAVLAALLYLTGPMAPRPADAQTQTQFTPQYCEAYARDRANRKSGGAVGGAVAGATTGTAIGHVADGKLSSRKKGAAIGAVVGSVAGAADRNNLYNKYYHGCLSGVIYQ